MTFRLLAGAALAGLVAAQALAADLTIEVHGIRSDDGRVYLAVHGPESKDTFPSGTGVVKGLREPARAGTLRKDTFPSGTGVVKGLREPARAGTLRFVVQGLAPGNSGQRTRSDRRGNRQKDRANGEEANDENRRTAGRSPAKRWTTHTARRNITT